MDIPSQFYYSPSDEEKASCANKILRTLSLLGSSVCPNLHALSLDIQNLDANQFIYLRSYAASWLDRANGRPLTRLRISSLRFRGLSYCQFTPILLKACCKNLKIGDVHSNSIQDAENIVGAQLEKLHFRLAYNYGGVCLNDEILHNIHERFPKLVELSLDGYFRNSRDHHTGLVVSNPHSTVFPHVYYVFPKTPTPASCS